MQRTVSCIICKKIFVAHHYKLLTCGKECHDIHIKQYVNSRKVHPEPEPIYTRCCVCDTLFIKRSSTARFCTIYCIEVVQKIRSQKQRLEVIDHYTRGTRQCAYCGDDWLPALQIDHMDGEGRNHTAARKRGLPKWLFENGYPSGYQILCASCNVVKRNMTDAEFRAKYPERIIGKSHQKTDYIMTI